MSKNKTTENKLNVNDFIDTIIDENRKKDFTSLVKLISEQSGIKPKMWGEKIVGFGSYHYKYDSGREGDAPLVGIASRVNAITFYVGDLEEKTEMLLNLGKHKKGKGCIYIQKIEDINLDCLIEIIISSIESRKLRHSN